MTSSNLAINDFEKDSIEAKTTKMLEDAVVDQALVAESYAKFMDDMNLTRQESLSSPYAKLTESMVFGNESFSFSGDQKAKAKASQDDVVINHALVAESYAKLVEGMNASGHESFSVSYAKLLGNESLSLSNDQKARSKSGKEDAVFDQALMFERYAKLMESMNGSLQESLSLSSDHKSKTRDAVFDQALMFERYAKLMESMNGSLQESLSLSSDHKSKTREMQDEVVIDQELLFERFNKLMESMNDSGPKSSSLSNDQKDTMLEPIPE